MTYSILENGQGSPVKAWINGVQLDEGARKQLRLTASLPFIHGWVAAMPDVHVGRGSTIGSVIPTLNAIIPAAVGVDLGCGMMAVQTSLSANDLPDHLGGVRAAIEAAVPHGRAGWQEPPAQALARWAELEPGFARITAKHEPILKTNNLNHLGSLGTGNHFIEVCLDETGQVWVMLHSGSRGVGNKIGSHFIELAQKDMRQHMVNLPDKDLAYFTEGAQYFDDYVAAVGWAQNFARHNREIMMELTLEALAKAGLPPFQIGTMAVNCHHNYVVKERHYGAEVWITRKGAVRAGLGELGIIPGSMGARSFIVRGKGNPESFSSCSHGAGRAMSRTAARKMFTVEDHILATKGVECRKDEDVIDETPAAYKDIDAVMAAQSDLVEIVHRLHQVVCVKG